MKIGESNLSLMVSIEVFMPVTKRSSEYIKMKAARNKTLKFSICFKAIIRSIMIIRNVTKNKRILL